MKILPIQDVYHRKFERQKKIDNLQFHAAGHCVHIGKISPGCYSCFVPDKYCKNIIAGISCNCDCIYCASGACTSSFDKKETVENYVRFKVDREVLIEDASMPDYRPRRMSFSGGGEPLLYKPLQKVIEVLAVGGIKVAALTNGSNLKGRMADAFAAHGTWIRISLDAWDDASYVKSRGAKNNEFTRLIDNIRSFTE